MNRARLVAWTVALGAIIFLVAQLSDEAFAVTRNVLVVASAGLFLALALAVLLRPVRRALASAFVLPPPDDGPAFTLMAPDEFRQHLPVILAAFACLAVAMGAMFVRG